MFFYVLVYEAYLLVLDQQVIGWHCYLVGWS